MTTPTSQPEFPATPTLDKMREVHDDSQTIGGFLEWLQDQHVALLVWRETEGPERCGGVLFESRLRCYAGKTYERYRAGGYEPDPNSPDCQRCGGTGQVTHKQMAWVPDGRTIEQLLADYFGIDLQQASEEKQAVFDLAAARSNARIGPSASASSP